MLLIFGFLYSRVNSLELFARAVALVVLPRDLLVHPPPRFWEKGDVTRCLTTRGFLST